MGEEQGIEEAREALIVHLISHCGAKGHPKAHCCLPFADTYALAVLDAAIPSPETANVSREEFHVLARAKRGIKERIERLGT